MDARQRLKAGGISSPRLVAVLGSEARESANDEPAQPSMAERRSQFDDRFSMEQQLRFQREEVANCAASWGALL